MISTSSYLICFKIIFKNRLLDSSLLKRLNKNKAILVTVGYEGIFVLYLHVIAIMLSFNIMYSVSNLFLNLLRNGNHNVSS